MSRRERDAREVCDRHKIKLSNNAKIQEISVIMVVMGEEDY